LTSNEKAPEITVEMLQQFSFKLITESMRIFESYREIGKNKLAKLAAAVKIHSMIIAAIRAHPDIAKLVELTQQAEHLQKVQTELERQLSGLKAADRTRRMSQIA